MQEKILFLTTAHHYNDDRIFFHQAKWLTENGFSVKICSLSSDFSGTLEDIDIESFSIIDTSVENKLQTFRQIIKSFDPDCIICSEPLAVISTKEILKRKKISVIYDITEWYPSMRMVERFNFPLNILHAFKFFFVQLYAGFLSTHYIFGEETKKFPLAYLFPFKKRIFLPYYPDESYINHNIKKLAPNKITLCYTGQFSEDKGVGNFFEAVAGLQNKKPDLNVHILLIGGARKEKDAKYFESLIERYQFKNIKIANATSFETFTQSYADVDVCFDLRSVNYENHHCLPIKIFYYAASGKPVIYSDLKATRKHLDVYKFGFLVNPSDADAISNHIIEYLDDPYLYSQHAHTARAEYENKYNWGIIRGTFLDFIKQST